jgi:hypothetical protein
MLGSLAIRAHIVEGHLRWVMAMGAVSLSLKCLLNWSLLSYGLLGLTLASSLTWFIVPSAHLWRLRSTLSGVSTWDGWLPIIALTLLCATAAGLWELAVGGPTSLLTPSLIPALLLWASAQGVAFVLLRRGGNR